MENQERRSKTRVATLNFVHYLLDGSEGAQAEDMGRTLDASERGLLIQTHVPLPVGQRISLSLGLGEDIIELRGEVVHCTEDESGMYRSGIEFDPLTADQQIRLSAFLKNFVALDG